MDMLSVYLPCTQFPNYRHTEQPLRHLMQVTSILSAAGTCSFAMIGFDVIATSAEEVINPGRNLPLAIIGSLLVCTVCYIAVSSVSRIEM